MGYQYAFQDLKDKKIKKLLDKEHERYLKEAILVTPAGDMLQGIDEGKLSSKERRQHELQYELFKLQPKYEKGELMRLIKNFYECLRAFTHGLPNEVYERFEEAIIASQDEKSKASKAFLKLVRGEIKFPDGTCIKDSPERFFMPFSKYIEYADYLHTKYV